MQALENLSYTVILSENSEVANIIPSSQIYVIIILNAIIYNLSKMSSF